MTWKLIIFAFSSALLAVSSHAWLGEIKQALVAQLGKLKI